MGFEELKVVYVCACSFCCFWLVFGCFALGFSIKSLAQNFYGVELNWHTQQISEFVVTEPGLKFVGLGNMIIEFPSTFQTMHFSNTGGTSCESGSGCFEKYNGPLRARSKDGLEIFVEVSFQWKLEPLAIIPLYNILGSHLFLDEFVRFAKSAIFYSCTQYPADQFFTNRTAIAATMYDQLTNEFKKPDEGLHCTIQGLQLMEVFLPDEFQAEITNTKFHEQEVDIAMEERQNLVIQKTQLVQVTAEQVNQTLQQAAQNADAITQSNLATIQVMLEQETKASEANAQILLQFADEPDPFEPLFQLMEATALMEHHSSKLLAEI